MSMSTPQFVQPSRVLAPLTVGGIISCYLKGDKPTLVTRDAVAYDPLRLGETAVERDGRCVTRASAILEPGTRDRLAP